MEENNETSNGSNELLEEIKHNDANQINNKDYNPLNDFLEIEAVKKQVNTKYLSQFNINNQ